jgi:hypothetical protein
MACRPGAFVTTAKSEYSSALVGSKSVPVDSLMKTPRPSRAMVPVRDTVSVPLRAWKRTRVSTPRVRSHSLKRVLLHPILAKAKSSREPLLNKEEKRERKNRTAQKKERRCNNTCDNLGLTKEILQI